MDVALELGCVLSTLCGSVPLGRSPPSPEENNLPHHSPWDVKLTLNSVLPGAAVGQGQWPAGPAGPQTPHTRPFVPPAPRRPRRTPDLGSAQTAQTQAGTDSPVLDA